MRILKLTEETKKNLQEDLLKRSPNSYQQYEEQVSRIIEEVRANGDEALFAFTKQIGRAHV